MDSKGLTLPWDPIGAQPQRRNCLMMRPAYLFESGWPFKWAASSYKGLQGGGSIFIYIYIYINI